MKRFLNFLILLVFVGALLFVGWKANIISLPWARHGPPDSSPTPAPVQREALRVAVPQRPEKLLMTSLKRLLQVENLELEIVDYNPQTVWLELANGEIDVVIAPVGEAVKAQGRFQAGHFLFFSGRSVGLDELVALPDVQNPTRVAVQSDAATDFLARQMLPEAAIIPARSASEVETWLKGRAVDAAMIDVSANSADINGTFKELSSTNPERPMPSVVILSKPFAENASNVEYTTRREVLTSAIRSWSGLVSYLDTQPELLKTTLRKEAQDSGVDVDRLLENYEFLSPARGRELLLEFQQQDSLKRTLDLLVLSGVANLSAPDWTQTVESPAFLDPAWTIQGEGTPTPEVSMTPSEPPAQSGLTPTYTYPAVNLPDPWPAPVLEYSAGKSLNFPPALSSKQVAVAAEDSLYLLGWGRETVKVPLESPITTPPLFDGRSFQFATAGKVGSVNSQGKTVWEVQVNGKPLGPAAVEGGRLAYAVDETDSGRLLCLDPVDGEILWETVLTGGPATGPVIGSTSDGTPVVALLDKSGELKVWNLNDGSGRWNEKLSSPSYLAPAAGEGNLAVVDPAGKVRLLDLQDGSLLWEVDLGSALAAPPTVSSRGVLVPSKDTYLYLLSTIDGSIQWKTLLSQTLSEPATVMQDLVAVSDEGGQVHTVRLDDGALLSSQRIDASWLSRVVGGPAGHWSLVDSTGKCRVWAP